MATVVNPLDMVRLSLDERVLVKCKGDRELRSLSPGRSGGGFAAGDDRSNGSGGGYSAMLTAMLGGGGATGRGREGKTAAD